MTLYSNEIVFRGHPDKVCDQISDALLTEYLRGDENSRCGIEVTGGKGVIFITGEVTSKADVNVKEVVEKTLFDIGYQDEMKIIDNIGRQSPDIALGVNVDGAGDQGMMFGYAISDKRNQYMVPVAMSILQDLAISYDNWVHSHPHIFKPDGKAQITGWYDDNFNLVSIKDFVISYNVEEKNREYGDNVIRDFINHICKNDYEVYVENIIINPTGKFEIGGFEADAGLTGRKIVCDSYHSFAPVGGGAFSGKDPTKVDRSGAYKARELAMRFTDDFDLDWCTVQISYAIGIDRPMAIYVNSNKGFIPVDESIYDECKPKNIIEHFDLKHFDYTTTSRFGHFGLGFPWEKDII